MADLVRELNDQAYGAYAAEYRNSTVDSYVEWKKRIESYRSLYRGDYLVNLPSQFSQVDLPKIANFVQIAADDIARMVKEIEPVVKVKANSSEEGDEQNARIKEEVFRGYWTENHMQSEVPLFAHDLTGTGFAACAVRPGLEDYDCPQIIRLNPKNCFPVFYNSKLLSLLHIGTYTPQAAEKILGMKLQKPSFPGSANASIEIADMYEQNRVIRSVLWTANGRAAKAGSFVRSVWQHDLDMVPVGAVWLKTADGALRGMFDQVDGAVKAMNKILHLELDYASEAVYSPFVEWDIENANEIPGPRTIYKGMSSDAFLKRVEPAQSSPSLQWLMQFLEQQIRAGISYPGQRQGNVSQSIGSAAFVDSTMGQLATTVKTIQYEIGDMREQVGRIAGMIDFKQSAGQKKTLYCSVDDIVTYDPGVVFKDKNYRHRVNYGGGAGLDALNKKVAILQDVGAGITSLRTAREQFDYIEDAEAEGKQIDLETFITAYKERLVQGADLMTVAAVVDAMKRGGLAVEETAGIVMELEKAKMASQQQGAPQPTPGPESEAAAGQAPPAQGGAIPQAPPEPIPGTAVRPSPPLEQAFVQ